jgi:hypothetical protein
MARLGSPLAAALLFLFTAFPLHAQTGYWVHQNVPSIMPIIHDIDMFNLNFGMAVGASINITPGIPGFSGVQMTTDGGNNWMYLESSRPRFEPELPDYTHWRSVFILDKNTAWIVGDSAMVYMTTDAGTTWAQQIVDYDTTLYGSRPTLHDIYMIDSQRGVIVGGDNVSITLSGGEFHPPQIYRTFNGGQQWQDHSPPLPSINNNGGALHTVDYGGGAFLYGGEYGNLLLDQGTGLTVIQPINPPSLNWMHWLDVDIKSPTEYYVVGTNWTNNTPAAYRSFANGTRFANMVPGNVAPGVQAIGAVDFLDVNNGWIGSSPQYLALTNNKGLNWTNFQVGTTPLATPMNAIDMVSSVAGWACGGTDGGGDSYIVRFFGSPPKPDISTSDDRIDFGTVTCEKSIEKELFIRNSGSGDLIVTLGDITFSSPDFSIANPQVFPLTIRPGQSASVFVRWTPAHAFAGNLVATMNISSNDLDHRPWPVELVAVRNHGILDLLSEYAVSFGTCIGDTLYYDLPVYTAGNRSPTFIKYEFVSGHDDYRILSPAPGKVIKNYETFRLRFAPQDSAMRRGVYRFIHGDPACPDTTLVAFSGVGQLTVVQASVTTIDFGQICVGQVKDTTITLRNRGNTYANIGILEHASGAPFFSSPDYSVFLLQDSMATYHLRFEPYSAGKFEAQYRATYGLCTDTLHFTFKGEALETKIAFDPKSPVSVGPVFANRTTTKTITITNTGTTTARLTGIQFTKLLAPLQFASLPKLPQTLTPGQSTSIAVRFSPTSVGEYNTWVLVRWDSRCAGSDSVEINASCVANPEIQAPTNADLGVQRCPTPLRDTIMIRNNGNGPLVFYSVGVSGPEFQHFTVIKPAINDTVKPGSNYPIIVEFNRPTEGRSNGIIRLTHNDFEAGRTDIAVTAERTIAEFAIEGDSLTAFFTRLFVPQVRQFTVRSVGSQPVTVTGLRVVKAGTVFSVRPLQPLPVTLTTNQTTTFEVTFTPNARGPFQGVVEVEASPCGNVHALTLTGSGDTEGLSADRADIDFVLDPCDFTPSCESIVLKNQSPEPVEVLNLSINPAGSAFAIDPAVALPFVMGSNAEKTIRVCANPPISGIAQATLVITSSDPAYPTLTVALRATRDSSGITVSESAIDFGRLADCMPATPRRITITNTGSLRETVDIAFVNGGNGFAATMTAAESINAGRTYSFDVSFTRPGYGSFDDVLVLTTQLCGTEFRIPLHAEAVSQEYLAAPNPLVFPAINVGGANTRQFTVQNSGGFDAAIARVEIQPGGPFTLSGSVPGSIGAGGTENIGIRFNPTSEGAFNATVCVIISSPCPDTVCIAVTGSAVRGTLEVHPSQLVFGTKAQCEITTLYDTLSNSGSGPITILSADVTGPAAAAFTNMTPVTAPEVLSAGGMRIFEIRYNPALAPGDGAVNAALTVRTDDAALPQFDIPLEAGRVTLRADAGGTVDFGPVQTGNPEQRSVTLRNSGSTPLCYTNASFPAELTVVPAPPFCIDPGNRLDLTLTLTTTVPGVYSGRFSLRVDSPCADSTIFTLTARGEQGTLTQVDSVDLGTMPWCDPDVAQFSIASSYLEAVTLENVRLEGADAAFFTIVAPVPSSLPASVAAGATVLVEIDFNGAQQTRDYDATFVSTFTAFGSTVERRTKIHARTVVPALSVTAASFPTTVIGQSAGPQPVTIANTSAIPLSVADVLKQLPDFIIMNVTPSPPAVLQPGASMTVSVNFVPQSVGQFIDSLVVRSDSPCPFSVSGRLTGEGIPQPIVNATLSLGSVQAKVDDVIDIPILTDKDLGPADVTGWAGSISFNRSMLWPMEMVKAGSLSAGMQVGFSYDNANGIVTITAANGTVGAGIGPLAWLRCRVLIGNALSTPLRMSSDFGFTGGYASVAGRVDGAFELVEYCMPDERLVNTDGGLTLRQNAPNPVSIGRRGTTSISFTLPHEAAITLDVYDMIGRHVRRIDEGRRAKGTHTILLDVHDLRQGVYIYMLRTAEGSAVRRMVVVP